jgi:hypothetical protein
MPGSWERSCLRRDRQFVRHGPSRAQSLRRVFCCPTHGSFDDVPAQAGTGDPDPGARAAFARARARGACRRERGDEPDTDGRANSSEFAHCGATQSAAQIYFVIWSAAGIIVRRGSTDAGGEDVGYFASNGKAGSTPAFDVTHCGGAQARVATRHSAGFSRKEHLC